MSSLRRRLLPAAALLFLASASPALASGLDFAPAATQAASSQAPTEFPGRTALDAPLPIVDGDTPGELALERRAPKGRIVAGVSTDVRSVPWQVWLYSESGTSSSYCGGSILNATTVLTAAHCVHGLTIGAPYDENGLAVIAGISNFAIETPTDIPQVRLVTVAKVHPGYVHGRVDLLPQGDVAILTFATPLDLSGPTAKPIGLPAAGPASVDGEPIPVGPAAKVSGFGDQINNVEASGQLYSLDTTIADPDHCGDFPNATGLCTKGPAGNICSGDSGGPLVSGGLLVGVVSAVDSLCRSGEWAVFTNLLAPENLQFIANPSVAPPVAPRQTASPTASSTTTTVGGVLTCSGAAFDGGASVKYVISNDLGARLAANVGASIAYTQTTGDVGRKLRCRAYGSNAGGVASSELLESVLPIAAPPAPIATPAPKAAPAPTPTPQPGGNVITNMNDAELRFVRLGLEPFARKPASARRGRSIKVTVGLADLPANVDEVEITIGKLTANRESDLRYLSSATKVVLNDRTQVSNRFTVSIPSSARVGKRYFLIARYDVTLDDGSTATGEFSFRGIVARR